MNPAEYLIDLAAIDNRSEALEAASHVRVNHLREVWQARFVDTNEEEKGVKLRNCQYSPESILGA